MADIETSGETGIRGRRGRRRHFVSAALIGVAAIGLAGASAAVASPAQPASVEAADFKAQADAILEAAYPADGPGAAAIVTRGREVIYSAGRGLADVEKGRPITTDSVFRLGSITKQFTAATILKLVEEGRISLDDPVSRFFPEWPQPGAGATVRQLLNHTSGIQDYSKIPGWIMENRTRSFTTDELLAVFRDLPAKARPGEEWEYNNGGYMLLGAIVEKVTDKPWHEAFAERIARPLGLDTVAYGVSGETGPAMARGYAVQDGRQQPTVLSNMSVPHAAGGLVGSVADMARWAQALHHGRVVSPALYREMTRPAKLADGSTETYGFGLRLRRLRGHPVLVHGGAISGFDTASAYVPSENVFVAVFANSDDPVTDPSTLVPRLAALALGDPIPTFRRAGIDMAAIEPLFGTYSAESGPPRRFFARDGKLYMGRGDAEKEAFPAGDGIFFFGPDELTWIEFARQGDGTHVMEVHRLDMAEPERSVRIGPAPPPLVVAPDVLRSYVGVYATEDPVLTVAMDEQGGLTIQPAGGSAYPMRPVSENEFRVDAVNTRVVFHKENGEVNRMTLYRGARQLNGRRTGR